MTVSGSPISPNRLAAAYERLGPVMYQVYGSNEAGAITLLTPADVDASRLLPPPPKAGSVDEQAEFQELKAIAARSTSQEVAAAAHDAKDETPDIFNAAIGFDGTAKPETFKLLKMVVEEEDGDTTVKARRRVGKAATAADARRSAKVAATGDSDEPERKSPRKGSGAVPKVPRK